MKQTAAILCSFCLGVLLMALYVHTTEIEVITKASAFCTGVFGTISIVLYAGEYSRNRLSNIRRKK